MIIGELARKPLDKGRRLLHKAGQSIAERSQGYQGEALSEINDGESERPAAPLRTALHSRRSRQALGGLRRHIENHAAVVLIHQPPHHVGAHPSQTDHAKLHMTQHNAVAEHGTLETRSCQFHRWRESRLLGTCWST